MLPEKHQSKFHQFTVSSLDKKKWFKPGTDKQCVVHIYRLHMWKVFWQSKYEDNKSQQSTYFNDFSSAFFCSISTRENGETFLHCAVLAFFETLVFGMIASQQDIIHSVHEFWKSSEKYVDNLKFIWKWMKDPLFGFSECVEYFLYCFSWFNENGNLLQTT